MLKYLGVQPSFTAIGPDFGGHFDSYTVGESDRYPVIFGQAEAPGRVHDLRPGRCVDIDTVTS
jgi:hypothetical protein